MSPTDLAKAIASSERSVAAYARMIEKKFPAEDRKESITNAVREAIWDDEARKLVRDYTRALRVRSEYMAIEARHLAEPCPDCIIGYPCPNPLRLDRDEIPAPGDKPALEREAV